GACAGGSGGGVVYSGGWIGARVSGAQWPDGAALCGEPVRRGRQPDVPHGGSGEVRAGGESGVSGAHGSSGEDPGFPDRAWGGGGGAAEVPGSAAGVGAGSGRGGVGDAPGGLCGVRRGGGGGECGAVAGASARGGAGVHDPRSVGGIG